jgi:glutathione S-transferase
MLTVHHLGISQSERIVWLCEELGLDYTFKRYERRADNRLAPDDYKALHPMGIAPVITDGDLVLGESGAICDYLCERYGGGRLVPGRDDPDRAAHLFWFHWSNATFMTTLMMQLVLAGGGEGNPAAGFVGDRARRGWAMVEARLGEAPFFGGRNLTTADIMMVYCPSLSSHAEACSRRTETGGTDRMSGKAWRGAVIAALMIPISAQAQGADTARAFTLHLYEAYRTGAPDYLGRDARRTFAPPLLALILRDRATTPSGDVGILDGDPICDCQDTGGVRATHLTITAAGPGHARARVTLRFPSETREMTLDLVAGRETGRGEWRVADVHTKETPSLVRLLEHGLHDRVRPRP